MSSDDGEKRLKFVGQEIGFRIHEPLPAEHPFYALVGRVASEWAHLEHILDLVIWDLAGWGIASIPNNRLATITSQIMGVPPRCKVIIALGRTHNLDYKTYLKPFAVLMNDSYSVADWRARWIHDPWYNDTGSPGAPAQFRAMPYRDQRFGIHEIDQAELDKTLDQIRELQRTAGALRVAVQATLVSWR